jgi:hypothetical protein
MSISILHSDPSESGISMSDNQGRQDRSRTTGHSMFGANSGKMPIKITVIDNEGKNKTEHVFF